MTEWYCPNCGIVTVSEDWDETDTAYIRCDECCGSVSEHTPLFVTAMQEEIATLETSLAERWENLNVQDGVIAGLQEEISALTEKASFYARRCKELQAIQSRMRDPERQMVCDILANGLPRDKAGVGAYLDTGVSRIAALEKVAEALLAARDAYPAMTTKYGKWIPVDEALREAGYLGGGE